MQLLLGRIDTPLVEFGALISPVGLARLTFPDEPLDSATAWAQRHYPGSVIRRLDLDGSDTPAPAPVPDDLVNQRQVLVMLAAQLNAYLEGRLRQFTVPLDLQGTPFQVSVWQALCTIPYGAVRRYSEIAETIGRPNAVRAVGLANGANPVPIVVPCHRVIGRDGTLTGYAGGLPLKERLLTLEGAVPPPPHYQQAQLTL